MAMVLVDCPECSKRVDITDHEEWEETFCPFCMECFFPEDVIETKRTVEDFIE